MQKKCGASRIRRIGLIANGEEAGKGSELVKELYPLLEAAKINFIGNVEGKEIFNGHADVAVTDGFTGNVFLKATEAVAKLLVEKDSGDNQGREFTDQNSAACLSGRRWVRLEKRWVHPRKAPLPCSA